MFFTSKPLSPQGRHVLITGASSGLGRETALHLAEQGFQVIAGVRRQEDGERLANACPSGRISTLLIDVTDEESIGRAAAQVAEKVGDTGLWGLVNNAGICISAPLECVSSDLLRRQLEVNLIGQLAVTRAILPLLRRGGAARLVNVTSGLGSVAIPYLGAYSAAQFAKEGVSDALRRELAPWASRSRWSARAIWTPIWGKIASEGER
ncbi:short-chain dehydrogenase, partial [Pseudomonas aeruginosa]